LKISPLAPWAVAIASPGPTPLPVRGRDRRRVVGPTVTVIAQAEMAEQIPVRLTEGRAADRALRILAGPQPAQLDLMAGVRR
jgi:hypothetical protein